jgi:deferrochelatase/peroxidase EfeB
MLPVAAGPAPGFSGNIVNADRDLGRNGTFLVVRQLEQDVESFWTYCRREGERLAPRFPPGVRAPPEEFIAAKIVGRWQDGSPLVRYPRWPASNSSRPSHPLVRTPGGPTQARIPSPLATAAMRTLSGSRAARQAAPTRAAHDPHAPAGPAFEPDNDFLFGAEDPQGLKCPYGAHIRRANPRESFDPGSREQLDITNRHRLLRVGRPYLPEGGQKPGLFFLCLNGDLERQFEFVQQTWAEGASFHGLANERDPLIGSRLAADSHSVPTRDGPMTLRNLPSFVRPRGGGYFLVPGRRTLTFLALDPTAGGGGRTAQ